MSQPDEEEKGDAGKLELIETAAKDILNKLKLVESLTKAIERLVTLASADKPDFLLALNSSVFAALKKYQQDLIPGFSPKSLGTFLSKSLVERALKAQAYILEHFSKVKDLNSIMSMQVDEGNREAK